MYHEEKIINGVLCYRSTPDGEFQAYTASELTKKYRDLKNGSFTGEEADHLVRGAVERARLKARDEERLRIADILGLTGVLGL